jgi:hypothetical protein
MYIKANTKTILQNHSEVRSLFSDTSLPTILTDLLMANFGVYPLTQLTKPDVNEITQKVSLGEPVLSSDGNWQQQWKVTARFSEYTNDKGIVVTKVQQENAAIESKRLASVPLAIAMAQARSVLILNNYMDTVMSALDSIPGVEGKLARSKFEFSVTVQRNDTLTEQMQNVLGLTSLQMDDLFIRAAQL